MPEVSSIVLGEVIFSELSSKERNTFSDDLGFYPWNIRRNQRYHKGSEKSQNINWANEFAPIKWKVWRKIKSSTNILWLILKNRTNETELQIKKNSCQTLGPASKRVLPDLSTFCQTYFFLRIFFYISLSMQYD